VPCWHGPEPYGSRRKFDAYRRFPIQGWACTI